MAGSLGAVVGAGSFVQRLSRESVNRTPTPAVGGSTAPQTVSWPVAVTGDVLATSGSDAGLYPGVAYVPGVRAGAPGSTEADLWAPHDCYVRAMPGAELAEGDKGVGRLIGWHRVDASSFGRPVYVIACCGAGGAFPGGADGQVPVGDGSDGLTASPVFVVQTTVNGDPATFIYQFQSSTATNPVTDPMFFVAIYNDVSGNPQFFQATYPSGTGEPSGTYPTAQPVFFQQVVTDAGAPSQFQQSVTVGPAFFLQDLQPGQFQWQAQVQAGPGPAQALVKLQQLPELILQNQQVVNAGVTVGQVVSQLIGGTTPQWQSETTVTDAGTVVGQIVQQLIGGGSPQWQEQTGVANSAGTMVGQVITNLLGGTTPQTSDTMQATDPGVSQSQQETVVLPDSVTTTQKITDEPATTTLAQKVDSITASAIQAAAEINGATQTDTLTESGGVLTRALVGGILDLSGVTVLGVGGGGLTWTKYTLSYTAWVGFSGITGDVALFSLPSKGLIYAVRAQVTTAFSTGSTTLNVVNPSGSNEYMAGINVSAVTSPARAIGQPSSGGLVPGNESIGSATTIYARLQSFGGNLNTLTAGSVDIYVLTGALP